jgi:ribosome-associated translation inhibitor RaiA
LKFPVQITFRNLEPSAVVEEWVQAEADKLETFYDHIISCRVAVEIPHRHHRKGKHCHVRLDLTLPSKEIVIHRDHDPFSSPKKSRAVMDGEVTKTEPHHNLHLAVHDAFKVAGRRVQDFARLRRGNVKSHETTLEVG